MIHGFTPLYKVEYTVIHGWYTVPAFWFADQIICSPVQFKPRKEPIASGLGRAVTDYSRFRGSFLSHKASHLHDLAERALGYSP